jgi:hypothetical protein
MMLHESGPEAGRFVRPRVRCRSEVVVVVVVECELAEIIRLSAE